MLHIILMILKVIGIILLVILGILLTVVLLLLFVPLRYRLHGRKEPGILEADGRVTWLLHLLRIDLSYQDKCGTVVLKVLGFRLKTFSIPGTAGAPETEKTEAARSEEPEPGIPEALNPDVNDSAKSETAKAEEPVGAKTGDKAAAEAVSAGKADTAEKEKKRKPDSSGRGLADRLMELGVKTANILLSILMKVPYLPAEVYDKIDSLIDKINTRYDGVRVKADPFLSIEAEHMLGKGFRYLLYILRGFRPRKIEGYLHFGTGAPDMTGKLAGLLIVLLPKSGAAYNVDPDFYEPVLETDTMMAGHARMYRVAWVAVRVLADREFWRLLKKIRGKDKKKESSGHRFAAKNSRKGAAKKASKKAA